MALDDRDYLKGEHYPSCTCVACCRRRSDIAAKVNWCDRHDRPMGLSGCQLCLLESKGEITPGNGMAELPQDAIDMKATATGKAASVDGRGQFGKRLGRTLRGILGKRAST